LCSMASSSVTSPWLICYLDLRDEKGDVALC
jgi:hypothetical protein